MRLWALKSTVAIKDIGKSSLNQQGEYKLFNFTPKVQKRLLEQFVDLRIAYKRYDLDPNRIRLHPFTSIVANFGAAPIEIGAFSYLMGARLSNITIGRYCSLASRLHTNHHEHPTNWLSNSPFQYMPLFDWDQGQTIERRPWHGSARIRIGNDVWIGKDVLIRPGITVGDGAVIGAHAVVTKDVPPYMIVGGVPARTIRARHDDALIERFMRVRWWQYRYHDLSGASFDDPVRALDFIEESAAAGDLLPFETELVQIPEEVQRFWTRWRHV